MATTISEQVVRVQERIAAAARRAGRDPADVLLVAVTKTHGVDAIQAAYEAGLRHFGENRVEEAESKINSAKSILPDLVTWHMIGHIQSRKAAGVSSLFSWVHSVDRLKVAGKLNESASVLGRDIDVLIEVNLSGEASKEGYALFQWPDNPTQADSLLQDIEAIAALPALRIRGLMAMPPFSPDPELSRPVFRRLRALRDFLHDRFPTLDCQQLSIGMSGDFEVAIEEGSTIVRLGTVLFGGRKVD
ncbi:MAG: YggS family pyridoxal phosphate-dependent enzyme [Anaerolineae bacterium]|nr:YggS family pyridoxal phosphate-dependent enzyme [Anaerolineae bacterium]